MLACCTDRCQPVRCADGAAVPDQLPAADHGDGRCRTTCTSCGRCSTSCCRRCCSPSCGFTASLTIPLTCILGIDSFAAAHGKSRRTRLPMPIYFLTHVSLCPCRRRCLRAPTSLTSGSTWATRRTRRPRRRSSSSCTRCAFSLQEPYSTIRQQSSCWAAQTPLVNLLCPPPHLSDCSHALCHFVVQWTCWCDRHLLSQMKEEEFLRGQ